MAGGNHTKAQSNKSSSSSSHRKSRWESGNNNPAADPKPSAAGDSKKPQPPPPSPPKSKHPANPKDNSIPKPSPSQQKLPPGPSHSSRPGPSPSGVRFPFPDNLGPPPPAYGFHMLDRRTIVLADGSVRSYFALPPDYQDFNRPPRPMDPTGRFLPPEMHSPGSGFDRQFPMSPDFRDARSRNQDYWNSLELEGRDVGPHQENSLKRKYGEEGERGRREEREDNDEFARQRQQLLQYGNVGLTPNGHLGGRGEFMVGTSSPYRRDDEMRTAKYMRGDGSYENMQGKHVGHSKHNEVDQAALKKAFLHFAKVVNENVTQKKNYLADGKQGPLQCVACSRSSKDFPDMHGLIVHTYNPDRADLLVDHLGLHKALCILMGWNYLTPPDNSKAYQLFSADEAAVNQDDLIMWPPVVIIHNTMTGKSRDGRVEGLGNKAMDNKLKDLGFSSGKAKSLYAKEGHLGVTLVKYAGDQSGLKEAILLAEFFEKDNRGRRSWAAVQSLALAKTEENNPNLVKVDKNTGEKERVLYGYLGTVSDLDKVDFETRKKAVIESRREYMPFK